MLPKKLTYNRYKEALSLVVNCKKQNESLIEPSNIFILKGRVINLSGKLSDSMFNVVVAYY